VDHCLIPDSRSLSPFFAMKRFFIKHVTCGTVRITGSDAKYIVNVLRMKAGDEMILFNGNGGEYLAEIKRAGTESVKVQIKSGYVPKPESSVEMTLAQGFLKDKKMDGLVRQVTELGIKGWVPFFAKRSVPRPNMERICARMKRWDKIAKEALKQCGRSWITQIHTAVGFDRMLDMAKVCDLKIIFWENHGKPCCFEKLKDSHGTVKTIFAIIGPEGGLTLEEVDQAKECGFVTAGLGPRILRAETATVAACALLQYVFGDIGN
jgi:16S rRNA (uracil1498-N3)-methyltransferase